MDNEPQINSQPEEKQRVTWILFLLGELTQAQFHFCFCHLSSISFNFPRHKEAVWSKYMKSPPIHPHSPHPHSHCGSLQPPWTWPFFEWPQQLRLHTPWPVLVFQEPGYVLGLQEDWLDWELWSCWRSCFCSKDLSWTLIFSKSCCSSGTFMLIRHPELTMIHSPHL